MDKCIVKDRTAANVHLSILNQDGTPILTLEPKEYFTEETYDWSRFQMGTDYLIRETTTYTDGRTDTGSQWSFSINDNAELTGMTMYDRKSAPYIQKVDAIHGEPLPGAVLQLEEIQMQESMILETWQSNGTPHRITSVLSPKAIYRIREITAPPGYELMEEAEFITFRLSQISGTTNQEAPLIILVDNLPVPELPQPPDEPDRPDIPETPNSPDIPPAPVIPPKEELIPPFPFQPELPEPSEPTEKTGVILAFYTPSYHYPQGLLFRRPNGTPVRFPSIPKTGDDTPWNRYLAVFTTSLMGILLTLRCRKKKTKRHVL